jgi:hypothetical protein
MDQTQLTAYFTENSINSVKNAISRKISSDPYFANQNTVKNSITDMDHQPYQRWFRGVYYFPDPIIMEREAGFRPIHNKCYKISQPATENERPDLCFEIPCSTTLPCRPAYISKYVDRDKLEVMINKGCIPQYR